MIFIIIIIKRVETNEIDFAMQVLLKNRAPVDAQRFVLNATLKTHRKTELLF